MPNSHKCNSHKCDCLNYCGDDPRIERGSVSGCAEYLKQKALTQKRQDLYKQFSVTNDQDLIVGAMHEMSAKVHSRLNNGLITVLGTNPPNDDAAKDRFWKKRVKDASDRLARAADRMESAA